MNKVYYAIKQNLAHYEGDYLINEFTAKKPDVDELKWWEGRGYSIYFGNVVFNFGSDVVEIDMTKEYKMLGIEERIYKLFNFV